MDGLGGGGVQHSVIGYSARSGGGYHAKVENLLVQAEGATIETWKEMIP